MASRRTPLGPALAALLSAGCLLGTPGGDTSGGRATSPVIPTATSVGLAQGAPTSATIGPAGGVLAASDGSVRLTVPAGAVAAATVFTATPISSRAPGALGATWRLEASGPLAGDVQVTFHGLGSYRSGMDLRSLTIRTQDARGFWVAPAAVAHDGSADTVTATTPHLSDWALVLADPPVMEGTFTLVQTVGVPFEATGTAALYPWTDSFEPTYLVTGTITIPPSLASGSLTCVPDAQTKDLDLSVAEVHEAVFRWGLNARWTLTCTDGATGAVSTQDLATQFDSMGINLPRCAGQFLGTQVNGPTIIQGSNRRDCGSEGSITAAWTFGSCMPGGACIPSDPCRSGTVTCSLGVGACTPGPQAPAGTSCGTGLVCDAAGACLACAEGAACSPAGACLSAGSGTQSCSAGPACLGGAPVAAGALTCDAAGLPGICDGSGLCLPCQAGQACTPAEVCHVGVSSCATGGPTCDDTLAWAQNGTACATATVPAGTCLDGACQ